jgi:hypothetical protein
LKQSTKAGKTRKKVVTLKSGKKIKRISARREYDAGVRLGTRYKVPDGKGKNSYKWKTLQLKENGVPFLSSDKNKVKDAFRTKKKIN